MCLYGDGPTMGNFSSSSLGGALPGLGRPHSPSRTAEPAPRPTAPDDLPLYLRKRPLDRLANGLPTGDHPQFGEGFFSVSEYFTPRVDLPCGQVHGNSRVRPLAEPRKLISTFFVAVTYGCHTLMRIIP